MLRQISAEELARLMFDCAKAVNHGDEKRSTPAWDQITDRERILRINAAQLALLELNSAESDEDFDRQRYFAKPGSAEWGC